MRPDPLATYFASTYRDPTALRLPPTRLSALAASVAWSYHAGALLDGVCALDFEEWRCGMRAAGVALHFEPPHVSPLAYSDYGLWLPSGLPGASASLCSRSNATQQVEAMAPDDGWVEVLRLGGDAPDDGRSRYGDGCWFLAAPGSGVFVHTGRSVRAATRTALAERLNLFSTHPRLKAEMRHDHYGLEKFVALCAAARAVGHATGSVDPCSLQTWAK